MLFKETVHGRPYTHLVQHRSKRGVTSLEWYLVLSRRSKNPLEFARATDESLMTAYASAHPSPVRPRFSG